MNTSLPAVDVLIIGAGPVGLSMAIEALRHGLTCRVVDQAEARSVYSKAQVVHARTLEVFENMGVVDAILAHGRPLHGFRAYAHRGSERVATFQIASIDSHYGYLLSIPQSETERLLEEHLCARGGRLERKVALKHFEQDAAGVTSVLVDAEGHEEAVRSRWLVGCDGAHSTVRKALDLPFEGHTYEQRIIQADVRVDLPLAVDLDETVMLMAPGVLGALFPLPGEHRYRFVLPLTPDSPATATLECFQEMMKLVGPEGTTVSDPAWMVDFRIHCRIAPRYQVGRVFLAGDAAHIHSPAGGQGMNMGIHDAHNLAWKLALVTRGAASAELLESYTAERRPVAEDTLAMTDTATRGLVFSLGLRNSVALDLRNQVMGLVTGLGAVRERLSRTLSMLEFGYADSPIVAQDRTSLMLANVMTSGATEAPSLRDWAAFGDGPAPGFRAPDVVLDEDAQGEPRRLHTALLGTSHTLLLFDGAAHTEAGYRNLARLARQVREAYGPLVRSHIVVPFAERPLALQGEGDVVLDPRFEAHRRYGARSECLYLVRPDGYVAYRCQPADGEKLMAYLARVFTATGSAASELRAAEVRAGSAPAPPAA
jgi:2-polyprenyl-6-methoxyphenol hydroxylase-like FAD-dependent oxidoreductase